MRKSFRNDNKIISEDQENVQAYNLRVIYYFLNEYNDAIVNYQTQYEYDSHSLDAILGLAYSLEENQDFVQSLKYYDIAINLDENQFQYLHRRGKFTVII